MTEREVVSEGGLPFTLDVRDSELAVRIDENQPTWSVELNVLWHDDQKRGRVRLAFRECIEARCGGRAHTMGWLGVYRTSEWLEAARTAHAARAPGLEAVMADVQHYVVRGGDLDFQVLARGCTWEPAP